MRTELFWLFLWTAGALLLASCATGADSTATPAPAPTATHTLTPSATLRPSPLPTSTPTSSLPSAITPSLTPATAPTATPTEAVPSEDVQGEQEAAERQEPEEPLTIAQRVWNKRIDDALAPSPCPAIPEVEIDDSYYSGPLIDTHLHIPPLLNGPPRLEELFRVGQANGGGDSGEQDSGVMPSLGENISISEIACTLEREGTTKAFAFFPVFPQVSRHLLEVANRTMLAVPSSVCPFHQFPQEMWRGCRRWTRMFYARCLPYIQAFFEGMARSGCKRLRDFARPMITLRMLQSFSISIQLSQSTAWWCTCTLAKGIKALLSVPCESTPKSFHCSRGAGRERNRRRDGEVLQYLLHGQRPLWRPVPVAPRRNHGVLCSRVE